MTDGYSRAEKEFLEPPDDIVGECEGCGDIDVLSEFHGHILCWECGKDRNENFLCDDEDDEIFTPEDLDHD